MANIDLDFLNVNALRNYPIKEGCSKVCTTGVFTIPNEFLVDASISASDDATLSFYVSKIANLVDYITIEISDSHNVFAGSFVINVSAHTMNKNYYLAPSDSYIGANGKITIDNISGITNIGAGVYDFTLDTAELEAATVIPGLQGISRITFVNADNTSYTLTGDVKIEARTNMRFKPVTGDPNRVVIDAGEGIGLNKECDNAGTCIKTINGIAADSNGNYTIDYSSCMTITPIPANTGFIIDDVCCKPCVGCSELETLTTRTNNLESSLLSLRDYYTSLQNQFNAYKLTTEHICTCS